jgi:hypothetical protein
MQDSSLLGRAKELEVASALIRNGIYVYSPMVDTGVDVVASNRNASEFIRVQVKFRADDPALFLPGRSIERELPPHLVLAFVRGKHEDQRIWFIPYQDWLSQSKGPQSDGGRYVNIAQNEQWLATYLGDSGVRHAFSKLLQ